MNRLIEAKEKRGVAEKTESAEKDKGIIPTA
jgi:hypothetical protein